MKDQEKLNEEDYLIDGQELQEVNEACETVKEQDGCEQENSQNDSISVNKTNELDKKIDNSSMISEKESEESIKIVTEEVDTQELKIFINQSGREKSKINVLQDIKLKTNVMKHLVYPTPISSKQRKNVDPQPAAISSPKYREYLENKAAKKNTEKKKENKENKMKRKRKRGQLINSKTKEHCWGCKEELDSDLDEGEAEHVGCDNCPRWYHLKCTGLSDRSLTELKDEYFKCDSCL